MLQSLWLLPFAYNGNPRTAPLGGCVYGYASRTDESQQDETQITHTMEFRIKQVRTYTTWLTIEADTIEEAEKKYGEMLDDGSAYDQELQQMSVDGEDYEIYPQ